MNRKRIAALLLALCLMAALCACGGAEDSAADTSAAPEQTAAPETTEVSEETTQETEPAGPIYIVKVTDEGGNPISGVMVQICLEACIPGVTGEDGAATFPTAPEADYKASIMSMPEGYAYATEQQEFYFDGGYEVTIVLKALA